MSKTDIFMSMAALPTSSIGGWLIYELLAEKKALAPRHWWGMALYLVGLIGIIGIAP